MKKLLVLIIASLLIFLSCQSVSTTHPDGSVTTLYPDGRMERTF